MGYRQSLAAARNRLNAAPRHYVHSTRHGAIEYADDGDGAAVLVSHPLFGGFDIGISTGRAYIGGGFRLIAPSRFGYLGSTLPAGARPADQADAFAELFDVLDLGTVPVFGYSAGGPAAIQLALRHPQRVAALVLLASALPGPAGRPPKPVARLLFGDLLFWLIGHAGPALAARILGMPKQFSPADDERDMIRQTWQGFFPVAPRKPGVLFDLYVSNPDVQGYPLEDLAVPTLIISARDDAMSAHPNAEAAAERIANAQLLAFDHGGHLLLGAEETVRQRVTAWITANTLTR
jgi:pimeloyl-ACP methyl ester carboxylesterase